MNTEKDTMILSNWDETMVAFMQAQLDANKIDTDDCGKQITQGENGQFFANVWAVHGEDRDDILSIIDIAYKDPIATHSFWERVGKFNVNPRAYMGEMIDNIGLPFVQLSGNGSITAEKLAAMTKATLKTIQCTIVFGLRFYIVDKDGNYTEYDMASVKELEHFMAIRQLRTGKFDDLVKTGNFFTEDE